MESSNVDLHQLNLVMPYFYANALLQQRVWKGRHRA